MQFDELKPKGKGIKFCLQGEVKESLRRQFNLYVKANKTTVCEKARTYSYKRVEKMLQDKKKKKAVKQYIVRPITSHFTCAPLDFVDQEARASWGSEKDCVLC